MNIKPFKEIKTEDILIIERELKVELPLDYKNFLLKFNGGIVEKDDSNFVQVEGLSEEIVIDVFFGIHQNTNSDILYWNREMRDELLEKTIIIADDIIQGFIVLICEGEDKGVYYWDDAYNFETSDDESNVYWIADDFTSFLEQLR